MNQEKLIRGCDICGYNRCAGALEWHHINDDKGFNPGDRLTDGTLKALEDYRNETMKCQLLCSNCHREIHWQDK